MRALITGGLGYIGQNLAHELLILGHEVVIVDNFFRGKNSLVPGTTIYQGDIRQPDPIWFIGVDVVFNLAAVSSVRTAKDIPAQTWETNSAALWGLMKAAHKAGVKRFIQASSREVMGNASVLPAHEDLPRAPINTYGQTKAQAEILLCQAEKIFQIPVFLGRLTNVTGGSYGDINDGRLIPGWVTGARQGKPLSVIGELENKSLDFVPVNQVVTAFIRAATVPRPITSDLPVNIGSGKQTRLAEVAQRIQMLYPEATFESTQTSAQEVNHFCADVRRMGTILGLTPPADPLAGLENFQFR